LKAKTYKVFIGLHPMLIDTHAHLYHPDFQADMDAVLQRCLDADVRIILLPNIDEASVDALHNLAARSTDALQLLPMMGLHPCDVKADYETQLAVIRKHLDSGKYYGIGETGLDYYWDISLKEEQKKSLRIQTEWAIEKNLPLIIHSRNSTQDCIELISEYKGRVNGIFHCFSGSIEEANLIIDLGFLLGIGGTLTYKNSGVQEVIRQIDLAHVVIETDAPYLSPVPFRGKRNESSYVKQIATFLAEVKSTSLEEIAAVTSSNAKRIFRLQ